MVQKRTCKICKVEIKGRRDKVFCSVACKNEYHIELRRSTQAATSFIDNILHRNRSILLEVLGNNSTSKKVDRKVLDKKKFNFKYHTHSYVNSKGKRYHYVYDFGWMEFSDQEILITRKRY